MGIEEQIDKLIDLGEDIKSRLDRLVGLASDHFVGAGKMVAEEATKWRIRQPGERVQDGDWLCEKSLPYANDPLNGPGWIDEGIPVGSEVMASDDCVFACRVAERPAEPAEHPAGPKPDPGEGYRLLSKEPLEDLTLGDEFEEKPGFWVKSSNAEHCGIQANRLWYRRKIDTEYREPSLPQDAGKWCEFSNDGKGWIHGKLRGYAGHLWQSVAISEVGAKHWVHARIKKDA